MISFILNYSKYSMSTNWATFSLGISFGIRLIFDFDCKIVRFSFLGPFLLLMSIFLIEQNNCVCLFHSLQVIVYTIFTYSLIYCWRCYCWWYCFTKLFLFTNPSTHSFLPKLEQYPIQLSNHTVLIPWTSTWT